ncbi:MAG: GNAT family N-acetyltransferase [Clostridiaceae bacterium]|nr:GNAT family N-acetyltransferase [Clostridiaceae bacterium]
MDIKDSNHQEGLFRLPLVGHRLSLHPLEATDLESMAPFFAQTESLYYYLPDTLLPRNVRQVQTMMDDWNDGRENFVFSCRLQNKTIGLLTLSALDPISGNAELGIMIAQEEARGKGYAAEALGLIMDYAFGELRLHRLYVRVAPDNLPSLKLFQGLGFVQEGRIRETVRRGHGYMDLLLFGLLEDEFRRMRAKLASKA